MERVFRLQSSNPLNVEVIRNILSQEVSVSYSPEFAEANLTFSSDKHEESLSVQELTSFAIGLGAEVPAEITRLMVLLLADSFTKKPIPASAAVISRLLEFYEFEIFPQVFSQGLYASPTAHLLLPVFGAGKVYYQGYLLKAADVHDIFSWQPVPWLNQLPASLTLTSFLGLANLVYAFIQLKKIFNYSRILLPANAHLRDSDHLFPEQIVHLETQLNSYLAFPVAHSQHLNGLIYQLEKLLSTFSQHLFDSFSDATAKDSRSYSLNNNVHLTQEHLLALMQTLNQENWSKYESGFDGNTGPSLYFTSRLTMQPYQLLKNLEQIMAIATMLQLITINPENKVNLATDLQATYRKLVIDVLQEAIFDELIRKTITFLYARVSTS